jgi:uncharacterized Zn-finger protein
MNDKGYKVIEVGAKEFMCIGVSPPFDHPHISCNLGEENEIICSYCGTHYRFNADLDFMETVPENCMYSHVMENT